MIDKKLTKKLFLCSEKGAALVEFALVLPLLLILLFGIIEFGFFIFNKSVITNASREGARAGVVRDNSPNPSDPDNPFIRIDSTKVTDIVKNYAAAHLVNFCSDRAINVTVDPVDRNLPRGDSLTVTASYDYCFLIIPALTDFLGNVNISGTSIMRAE
jgi:Flp pilus assembly protein TadG